VHILKEELPNKNLVILRVVVKIGKLL